MQPIWLKDEGKYYIIPPNILTPLKSGQWAVTCFLLNNNPHQWHTAINFVMAHRGCFQTPYHTKSGLIYKFRDKK